MIEDHIEQIQAKIRNSPEMPEATRLELLDLIASLKSEVAVLSETRAEEASQVARSAAVSTHEATREDKEPELLEAAIGELNKSVEGLEASHPQLTQVVNRIAVTLSNMGI